MTKPKTWADRERSLDVDGPPHQPITLMDMVAESAPSSGISLAGAQSNKSRKGCTATKKRHQQYAVSNNRGPNS
jgi:hypothetical protein